MFACDTSPQKVSFDIVIDGMSCSRSCSPYIEKKLKKMEGVFEASVSFEKKLAEITIDANEISIAEVINEIETIADRQYKVEAVKESEMEKKKRDFGSNRKTVLGFRYY
jgi:Cu+-exporting ATPase